MRFFPSMAGGATLAAALAAIPILSLFMLNAQGKLNITGWEPKAFHGLYSRVKLFIKNGEEGQQNGKVDLVAQVPIAELGNYSKYKWCSSDKSKLKKQVAAATSVSTVSSEEKCELSYFSADEKDSKLEEGVSRYLLETITKWIEVQHVANMLLLYDKDVQKESKASTGAAEKIRQACKITNSDSFEVIKDLFLGSSSWSKDCLMSPISVNLYLKLSNSPVAAVVQAASTVNGRSITKEQLQSGTLSGIINYGIFDYSSYNKLKEIPAVQNGGNKNYSLKINWQIPYSLKNEENGNGKCSLEKLHEKTRKRELKLNDIKECILTVS